MAELILRVAGRVVPTKLADGDMALLMPALLASPAGTAWKLSGAHLDLLRTSWGPTALEYVHELVPTETWPTAAERVWKLSRDAMALRKWSSFTVGDRIAFLGRDHRGLAGKVLAHLPWTAVEATIVSDGLLPTSDPVTTLGAFLAQSCTRPSKHGLAGLPSARRSGSKRASSRLCSGRGM